MMFMEHQRGARPAGLEGVVTCREVNDLDFGPVWPDAPTMVPTTMILT
jgi:hypothetical protein